MNKETKIVFSIICAYWIFVFLRIFEVIDVSWWIVLLPFWILFFFIGIALAIWLFIVISLLLLGIMLGNKCKEN